MDFMAYTDCKWQISNNREELKYDDGEQVIEYKL